MAFYCFFNGTFYPAETPLLQTNDLGLLRGYGLFDYFRTYNGVPFRFDEYWERFNRSAARLHLPVPLDKAAVAEAVVELIRLSGEEDIACRLVLTGGFSADGVQVSSPNFFIRSEKLPVEKAEAMVHGIKVIPYLYVRDLPDVKMTSYVHMILNTEVMKRCHASDLLFHKDGQVSELTRSNVFIFKGDTLITPEQNVLKGITRKFTMELASAHFEVRTGDFSLDELLQADEVFITSTTKWAIPVVQVGDAVIGKGTVGKRTMLIRQLMEDAFKVYGSR